ncbi:MAG: hypothetical protein SVO01_08340 [Thermotogota bacterium]|nr:hypothetical protein [Thermotogota bacterium]
MKSKIDSIYIRHDIHRIYQGDILRDFEYTEWACIEGNKVKMMVRTIPYLVILTQDCDLKWDYNNHNNQVGNHDKFLHSILVCPAYLSEEFRQGIHLEGLGFEMGKINSKIWGNVKNNQNQRYHYLERDKELNIPDLVIDFKHYYTIQRDLLYRGIKDHYIATVNELFREALSQRFSYYLSRIGVPLIPNEEN